MRKQLYLVTVGILLSMMSISSTVWSVEFVADQLTHIGDRTYRASLFCREDRCRMEHNSPGSIEVTIVRKDKGLMRLLSARLKRFKTLPIDVKAGPLFQPIVGREVAREIIGTETLDGHPTTLSLVTVHEVDRNVEYYQWWADDLQLPLRVARRDGAWIVDYKNIRIRRV